MKISITRTLYFLGTLFFGWITWSMLQGTLQEKIHFVGTANEIAFTLVFGFLSLVCGIYSVSK
jgi:hypothetical protein